MIFLVPCAISYYLFLMRERRKYPAKISEHWRCFQAAGYNDTICDETKDCTFVTGSALDLCVDLPGESESIWSDGNRSCAEYANVSSSSDEDLCRTQGAVDFNGEGAARSKCCVCGGGQTGIVNVTDVNLPDADDHDQTRWTLILSAAERSLNGSGLASLGRPLRAFRLAKNSRSQAYRYIFPDGTAVEASGGEYLYDRFGHSRTITRIQSPVPHCAGSNQTSEQTPLRDSESGEISVAHVLFIGGPLALLLFKVWLRVVLVPHLCSEADWLLVKPLSELLVEHGWFVQLNYVGNGKRVQPPRGLKRETCKPAWIWLEFTAHR
jgi:hypothetical protein